MAHCQVTADLSRYLREQDRLEFIRDAHDERVGEILTALLQRPAWQIAPEGSAVYDALCDEAERLASEEEGYCDVD